MRSVLITGASTGIGRACARRLDAAGWKVFAGVRREEDAEALRREGSELITPLRLDVQDAGQIADVAEWLAGTVGDAGLDGLVNNAGIAVLSPLETLPIEDFRRQIEVNLTAQVAVTQAMLPSIRRATGRIVFITSIGGRIAFPFSGGYHAAKFGLEAVGDVFRQELEPWGICVSIVEPGSIDTPIWERGEREADRVNGAAARPDGLYDQAIERYRKVIRRTAERGIPPDRVATAVEHALGSARPRTRYLVGLDAKFQARARPFIPTRLLDRIVRRAMR